ncbi:hypothetical protein [Propionibacterium australiense]|uniref:Uncharacterized protein n=1 Tax=Propionibacterium australiense TaxID=119981 RepID=A0A383S7K2_9ACTN|nr:hypothetical protein [Propionibacterium australiense]RLP07604.1 hypothetical protein D9T14_10005 [Propionibacterium australiense]RLP08386.1 hypothetical protein D7U36_09635 [Propionibacterium australiense]SYZ33958.1 Hypothetical protein PROPAUS_1914 [Propionibacterium australiense]VEH88929.1 Uncharacterised protein [Propionibacterium australiense]
MSYGAVIMIAILGFVVALAMGAAAKDGRDERAEQAAGELGLEFIGDDPELGATVRGLVGIWERAGAEQVVTLSGVRYGNLTWTTSEYNGDQHFVHNHVKSFMVYPVLAGFPATRIRREGLLSLPFNDINTEDEAFNREWDITGDDEAFALALLTPQVRAWVTAMPFEQLYLTTSGQVVGYDAGRYDAHRFGVLRDALEEFVSLIPAELLHR